MNTSDITNYIQKMEQLIQMQQIELDKTRNLLARAIQANDGSIEAPMIEYAPENYISFEFRKERITMEVLPHPMKSMYEQITELKKELNL